MSEEDRRQPANNTDLGQLADPMPSPVNVTDSMFDGIVGDGRWKYLSLLQSVMLPLRF